MERRLLALYFTERGDIGDPAALAAAAATVGLDEKEVQAMLASDAYIDQVRREERRWRATGIDSVSVVIVDDRCLIAGGQPPEELGRQLRAIVAATPGRADG